MTHQAFMRKLQPQELSRMRAILLWMLGIPIPVIILLYLFGVF